MRMRIQLDCVVEFPQRDGGILSIGPNDFIERGISQLLRPDEGAYIEPGADLKLTRLGATGKRMISPKEAREHFKEKR